MLDATTPAFRQQYPNGATVYDRTGRRIGNVIACNPETGEVITYAVGWIAKAWFNALWVRDPFTYTYLRRFDWLRIGPRLLRETVVGGELLRRHGFWPAPLTIRANPPPPPKHPMCRCVLEVLPGDTVTVIGITGPNEHFNGSYTVSSVSHNIIPAID